VKDNAVGHHTSARSESSVAAPNAALLIDFDNVTMGIRSDLQNQLRRLLNSDIIKGKVSVQRAYADWRRYPQYIVPLSEASIDLIFAPAFGANKKNATDIRLAIDALELIFIRPEIGTFILLSGDSDFSALVLKLKEYGKYVIGVGIRESSSDLLIQNCDEYFSYSEITGLAKEGEVEQVRRDPWELVVEAVQKMIQDGDVMRSDRLKQVMQGIDPNFDEKDAGFNRFSKFVVSAAQRGLLALTKMENGQYAIDIGDNANVPLREADSTDEAESDLKERPAVRRKGSKKRSPAVGDSDNLTLSESFELLKQALRSLGAVGPKSTDHASARAKMIELCGSDSDPVYENRRFLRMLRQAHDADLIELIKGDGDQYLLKLSTKADARDREIVSAEVTEAAAVEEAPKKAKRTTRRKSATARSSTRAKKNGEAGAEAAVASSEGSDVAAGDDAKPAKGTKKRSKTTSRRSRRSTARVATKVHDHTESEPDRVEEQSVEEAHPAKRNPRLRHGSRKPTRAPTVSAEQEESSASVAIATPAVSPASTTGRRSLGSRRGSRGRRSSGERSASGSSETDKSPEQPRARPSTGVPEALSTPEGTPKGRSTADQLHDAKEKEGLFHKLTVAIQKAVGGTSPEDSTTE
jgi:uncharacterized protein (TIGR00288 family)